MSIETYRGNGTVSVNADSGPVSYTLRISTTIAGDKSGEGSFTGQQGSSTFRAALKQQPAELRLDTGQPIPILIQDGDPLLAQHKFITNGPIPPLSPPARVGRRR